MVRFQDIKEDLFEAICTILKPTLTKEQQDDVVAFMRARGHDMTWSAI